MYGQSTTLKGRENSLPNPHAVLYEPFIDSFCWVCHEYTAPKVRFRQNIGQ